MAGVSGDLSTASGPSCLVVVAASDSRPEEAERVREHYLTCGSRAARAIIQRRLQRATRSLRPGPVARRYL